MRSWPLLIVLVPTVGLAQPVPKHRPPTSPCQRPDLLQTAGPTRPGVHKLGEMLPAKPIYTVLREVDGCPRPVSVRPR